MNGDQTKSRKKISPRYIFPLHIGQQPLEFPTYLADTSQPQAQQDINKLKLTKFRFLTARAQW